jgi:glyoxylase-like metal-dependent hydrolase (beta-lactamase superfamily II)
MLERKYVFPHVIEMNYQAGHRLGCNVYLIDGTSEWLLIDIGYEETVREIVELIRQMDFPLSACKLLIATHADADHVQGLAKAKEVLRAKTAGHPLSVEPLATGDTVLTYAEIKAQKIFVDMPPCQIDVLIDEGDVIEVGDQKLEVWYTPGHTNSQLSFRLGDLLISGDNIYRDGCVGVIDAHHGSDIPSFITSLERIRDSDVKWLLPSHGPIFPKDNRLLQQTIDRLSQYQYMADFGTCAIDWPLMHEWEREIAQGIFPMTPKRAAEQSRT